MARLIAVHSSGSLGAVGSGQIQNLLGILTASIQQFTSSGVPSFQLAETVTGTSASLDLVFHSVGDRALGADEHIGDADVWFRLVRTAATTVQFGVYQDWSPTSSDGTTSFSTNPGGARSATITTQAQWSTLSDSAALDWWGLGNGYEHAFVFNQGGSIRWLFFGQPPRLAPPGLDGIARIRTATTGSGAVTIELDRNVSGSRGVSGFVQPGQRVWIVPQTPDNTTIVDAVVDIVTVDFVYSGSGAANPSLMNVSSTTKTYPSGSLVGLYPATTYVAAGISPGLGVVYFTNRPDAGYTGAASQIGDFESAGRFTESDLDPDASNMYYGLGVYHFSDQATFTGIRGGTSDVLSFFSIGTQANGDRMIVGNRYWFAFPTISSITSYSGFTIGIGPLLLP